MSRTRDVDWRAATRELRAYVARRVAPDDVDDVVQEILLRTHERLGDVRSPERLGAWLNRVARGAVADHHRARSSRVRREREAAVEPSLERPSGSTPSGEIDEGPDAATILAACMDPFVELLPEPYREAVRLVELEGLTHREAAERAGVSVSAMKSRARRGRALLRGTVEECCAVELDARNRVRDLEIRADPDCCTG